MKNSMSSLETRKLNYLCQVFHPGIGEAWRYYQQNRELFKYPVYVPFLDMVVHSQSDLKFLNNSVGARDAYLFIFGCKEDEDRMMQGGNRFGINSSIVDRRLVSGLLAVSLPSFHSCRGFSSSTTAIAGLCRRR
jgi:hypothetical protein